MRHTQRYESGRRAAQGELVDGRREGAWTFWDQHGRRYAQREYEGGARQGGAEIAFSDFVTAVILPGLVPNKLMLGVILATAHPYQDYLQ